MQYIIAFIWGLAEATFFFILPDVYLTRMTITSSWSAIKACLIACVGAICGGALMYVWGYYYPLSAFKFLTFIPAIFPKLLLYVVNQTLTTPFISLSLAPLFGIPYKIYAVSFGASKLNFLLFICISFVARLLRFLITACIAIVIVFFLKKYMSIKKIYYVHLYVWFVIYVCYFLLVVYGYG